MKWLLVLLKTVFFGWLFALRDLIKVIAGLVRRYCALFKLPVRERRAMPGHCFPVDVPAIVRPDPLIYAQYYLMKRGFAVTWDNPDIQLKLNGTPVSSSLINPDTTYEIVARIWNGSPDAPVVDMPVIFYFLEFGVGTVRVLIGTTKVTLGVKGGPNHPAFASMPWKTPPTPGHYCIQVLLDPFDDSNRLNNLGQENTNVGKAHSPVTFAFLLRNDTPREHRYRFEVDAYTIGDPDPCADKPPDERTKRARLARHLYGAQPIPPGWHVEYSPDGPAVAGGASVPIQVRLTPPAGFIGEQNVNVNIFHEDDVLVGGVTLTVQAP